MDTVVRVKLIVKGGMRIFEVVCVVLFMQNREAPSLAIVVRAPRPAFSAHQKVETKHELILNRVENTDSKAPR